MAPDRFVYLDHAASAPMRPEVLAAMVPVLTELPGNPSGIHRAARAAKTTLETARETIAAALGAAPGEVVLTGGGTEADNLAVLGAARAARSRELGDGVIVSAFEHRAVLAAADRLASEGFRVRRAAVDRSGIIDLDWLSDALDDRTVVVSVMLVNNEIGTIQPLHDVAGLVRERAPGAVIHTDAVQAAPWLDVAERAASAELVAVSAHKLGGPKGVGALVVRDGTPVVPMLEGGGQERGVRSGTVDVAGAVGLATALSVAGTRRHEETERITALRDRLRAGLTAARPDLYENGDPSRKIAGNLHLGFPGVDAETLLVALDRRGLAAAAGSSCSSGATEPSHVLAAIGLEPADARSSIRLSLGWASTAADVDDALDVIPGAVEQLRLAAAARR